MSNILFRSLFGLAAAALLTVPVMADPVNLGPSQGFIPEVVNSALGGTVGTDIEDTFSVGGIGGKVHSYVISGVDSGLTSRTGLTFVYEISNTSGSFESPDDVTRGVTSLSVAGWKGVDLDIATRNDSTYSSGSDFVVPDAYTRSADGDVITFTFPPDIASAPPIWGGEVSWQLILFTDLSNAYSNLGIIGSDDFETRKSDAFPGTYMESPTFNVLSASTATVPDTSSTLALVAVALGTVGFLSRRRR